MDFVAELAHPLPLGFSQRKDLKFPNQLFNLSTFQLINPSTQSIQKQKPIIYQLFIFKRLPLHLL